MTILEEKTTISIVNLRMFLRQCCIVYPDMTSLGSAYFYSLFTNFYFVVFFERYLIIGQILRLLNLRLNNPLALILKLLPMPYLLYNPENNLHIGTKLHTNLILDWDWLLDLDVGSRLAAEIL